jgi:cell division protein FtsI (penicillin-binding protein 3)
MPTSVPPSSGVNGKRHAAAKRLKTRHEQKHGATKGKQPLNNRFKSSPLPFFRLLIVWGVLVGASLGIAANLYQLQVVRAPELLGKARKQQIVGLRTFIPRRPVVDRNNNVLAMDRPVYTLYAHPKLFKFSKEAIAAKLSPILDRPAQELVKKFNTRTTGIKLGGAISEEMFNQIALLRLSGLDLVQQYSRLYPQNNLVADVVGYVNTERRGQAGVEYSQEKLLERPVKTTKLRMTGNGGIINYYVPKGFVNVDDLRLQLTLDMRLQRAAQLRLQQQLQKFNAKRGSVIVMDVRDGAILAMVAEPSYDPNEYYKSDVGLFKNWALSDLYEPGSTFKPLNVAIALEAGKLKPNEVFHDPGMIKVGGRVIKNAEKKDITELSVAQILQYSSNVGMVQIMQRMQPATYYSWLKRLGLGQSVRIDLPFEASSQIKSQKQFISYPIEPATASFGQGFSLTPIQLVQLHGAIANGGRLVTPHVVRGLFDAQGQPHWQPQLPAPRQVFSPQTTQKVLEMMETVVTQGSGKAAIIPGYRIAGKTGTAQKASSRGGYDRVAKITSFISILPVDSPRYVVLAVIDEPTKGEILFGSTVAAPLVKSVIDALISIERIPPSQAIVKATPSPSP